MKKILVGLSLLIFFNVAYSQQFEDDFDDLSFPNDPNWFGDIEVYGVNGNGNLQLMDDEETETSVYALVQTVDSTVWEFWIQLDFDPSTSNFLKVYLQSNSEDLDNATQGYFVQIGVAGSLDSLQLRRQDNNSSEIILGGTPGAIAEEPTLRLRVVRNDNADWSLYADYTGGTDFQFEGTTNDATYNGGDYFGFKCKYGVTRADKFFFDDISISPIVEDQSSPELIDVQAIDANTLQVTFDEPLGATSAENELNYAMDNGVVINDAMLDMDPSVVILDVSSLNSGVNYTLTTDNIDDINGNISGTQQAGFTFFSVEPAEAFDILINEILPNPDPEIAGLPDAEFIELYNRSDKAIDLAGFLISDASNTKTLSSYIMPPDSYLIICDEDDVNDYSNFGSVLGVSGLFALNDSGDDVRLENGMGLIIHEVSYTSSAYQDDEKDDGGWSLELINPTLFCQGISNWRASVDTEGGTPGEQNSLFDNMPDLTAPQVLDAIAISENQIRIIFSETMSTDLETTSAYSIEDAGEVVNAVLSADLQSIVLTINTPFFQNQQTYTLILGTEIQDCSGNLILEQNIEFTYLETEPASPFDILINEFYPDFNPSFGLPEQEYVELFNRSNKTINLEGFVFVNGNEMVTLPFFLLQAQSYVTVYEVGVSGFGLLGDTIALDNFIGLGNDADEFAIFNPDGELIHLVDYDKSWYQDSDKTDGGWSIELINPDLPCDFQSNYRASVAALGGTPGQQNSVFDLTIQSDPLKLIRAFPVGDNALRLYFNKSIDRINAEDVTFYEVEGLNIVNAEVQLPLNEVLLTFSMPLTPGQIYTLTVQNTYVDCDGKEIGGTNSTRFALAQEIEVGDLVINEVLYDPSSGGVRFLELYNNSDKVFNIGELHIADRDEELIELDANIEVIEDVLLFPSEYIVFTPSSAIIQERFIVENPEQLILNPLPAWDSKEDAVVIFVPNILGPDIIDEIQYDQTFHNRLLDDEEGVSLERINFDAETQDASNWQSAAETAGFATPTYQNSQFVGEIEVGENIIDIPEKRLSPDGDGFEDFLLINYNTSAEGWVANIQLFDANGRLVKRLIQNQTLGGQGSFRWDGDRDDGTKARIGIYIVWIELFKADGTVQHHKIPIVVAGQLN